MRVVVADDEVLLREGVARLLTDAGFEVVGTAGDAAGLEQLVAVHAPDVALIDIRMPPTHTDEGLAAARRLRTTHPGTAVLVLSHHVDSGYAVDLLERYPSGTGYLLKERVSDLAVLTDALRRLDAGECVIDPTLVARLLRRTHHEPLAALSEREREVLGLIAEGRSNAAVCERLQLSPRTVEAHIRHIFTKLGLEDDPADHRRVIAALTFLRSSE